MKATCSVLVGLALGAALWSQACSSGSGTAGGSTSSGGSAGAGASGGNGGTAGAGAAPTGGTGGGSGGTAGAGGVASSCVHDPCDLGMALDPLCDPCVAQTCAVNPSCCADAWNYVCMDTMQSACGSDCGQALPTCDTLYSSVQGYTLCEQAATTCSFAFLNVLQSCSDTCTKLGGECITSVASVPLNSCQLAQEEFGCAHTGLSPAVCICSRGCGVGPACAEGHTCANGHCI